jgi:hypothetical protein
MIDQVKKVVETILDKDAQGNPTPEEFNLMFDMVQQKIFRGYFSDINRDQNKENRGLSNPGYANLEHFDSTRIDRFLKAEKTVVPVSPGATFSRFTLPDDFYLLVENSMITLSNRVIERLPAHMATHAVNSIAAPSEIYPAHQLVENSAVRVYPNTVDFVAYDYIRKPKTPKWTYLTVNNNAFFNPAATDFQDFELHPSEFSNIVIELCSLFGIHLREAQVMNVFEVLKQQGEIKENQ